MDYRFLISIGIFVLIVSWEWWRPLRLEDKNKFIRWVTNIGIGLTNIVLIKIFAAGILITLSNSITEQQIGLIHWLNLSSLLHPSIIFIISLLLLDFLIYVQHVASHHIPLLWRLHKVHHTDKTLDATTAIRFHPLEIFLSLGYKAVLIMLFGFDMYSVILFEILLNGSAIFNHGNINLPKKLDAWLKKVIITPNVHFIHHSTVSTETNSNYGFFLIWWDKIFSTYQADAHQPVSRLELGLEEHKKTISYFSLLLLPFKSTKKNKS
jgi:sterol desaturase/sphingolipid hydroxylase (fatty acid hydroxylase superfamily)